MSNLLVWPVSCPVQGRGVSRTCLNAILFVLRTGCQWNALNATGICPGSTTPCPASEKGVGPPDSDVRLRRLSSPIRRRQADLRRGLGRLG